MPYNRLANGRDNPSTYGFDGATITYSSGTFTVPNTVKAITVIAAGDIVCRPAKASANITITAAPVGYVLPWHCLTITQSGTTASLATVIG